MAGLEQTIIKAIAIHLPQFHPTPENDEWWGKGFTEWTNVAKAVPYFPGHRQPRYPADGGYYDLRLTEVHEAQAKLATEYGIEGFAYYHYWFGGKRLLHKPVDAMLASGKPQFPFCLIWANETWSRRWLGEEAEILIKQEYNHEDDAAHAKFLSNTFADDRYITIDNRPVFTIYRPGDLPDVARTISIIKETAIRQGIKEPYMVASNSHDYHQYERFLKMGFDAILNFRPQLGVLPLAFSDEYIRDRLIDNIKKHKVFSGKLKVYNYRQALDLMQQIEPADFSRILPSVFTGWDNTPRRAEKGIIMVNNHPHIFEEELERVVQKMKRTDGHPGIFFINAWNEWAEGNYLEPDTVNGYAFLKAVSNVLLKHK